MFKVHCKGVCDRFRLKVCTILCGDLIEEAKYEEKFAQIRQASHAIANAAMRSKGVSLQVREAYVLDALAKTMGAKLNDTG